MTHDDPTQPQGPRDRLAAPASMIRAVFFDAAGTLIRVREPVGLTYARLAAEFGVTVRAAAMAESFRTAFRAMPPMAFPDAAAEQRPAMEKAWWAELVRRTFRQAAPEERFASFEAFFERLFSHYARPNAWVLADGAPEALTALRTRGLHTGVISNFDHRLPGILAGLGLHPRLETVVLPAEAGAAKPDARIFDCALHALGITPREAVYVGDDHEQDILGARAAGLHAVDVGTLLHLRDLLHHLETLA